MLPIAHLCAGAGDVLAIYSLQSDPFVYILQKKHPVRINRAFPSRGNQHLCLPGSFPELGTVLISSIREDKRMEQLIR